MNIIKMKGIKQANNLIIENFGIWYSPVQLCKFINNVNNTKELKQALNIIYNHLCGK